MHGIQIGLRTQSVSTLQMDAAANVVWDITLGRNTWEEEGGAGGVRRGNELKKFI